jgi:hypothetical protein
MDADARRDVYLDAIALVAAHHRRDEEAFNSVVNASGGCPWYLAQLVNALAELSALALEDLPEDAVDEFLAEVRQFILERP